MQNYDPQTLNLLAKTLVGAPLVLPRILLTPIPSVFNFLAAHASTRSSSGWWPRVTVNGTDVVLTPQGSAALDLVPLVASHRDIIFAGYAGSVGSHCAVGDIVSPSSAAFPGTGKVFPLAGNDPFTIITMSHLTEGYRLAELGSISDCLIDMESAFIASFLKSSRILSIRVLITDCWPDNPFYISGDTNREVLSKRRNDLSADLLKELL